MSRIEQRVVDSAAAIGDHPPEHMAFQHSLLCQLGLPRRRTDSTTFERRSGSVRLLVEAGKLYDGTRFVQAPLPYGPIPRLVLVHISSEAVRQRSRRVEVGRSMREFLLRLGLSPSGGERGGYVALGAQIDALAACRLTLGTIQEGRVITQEATPFTRYEAWSHLCGGERVRMLHSLELSEEFYDALVGHAVPLDPRALAALRHSSLALDVYCWLAQRLRRVTREGGNRVSWRNLCEQFGQEYRDGKNFKREFRTAFHQAVAVYPAARFGEIPGGLMLFPSRPPVERAVVAPRATG